MDHQHHHHPLKNSNHATTTTTRTAMTATQMRATLIYLAPFLQPCKNVVQGTNATTRTQQHQEQHLQQHHHLQQQNQQHDSEIAAMSDKTHVLRNRVSSSRSNNHNNNAINCYNNSNNNNNTTNTNNIINTNRHKCCSCCSSNIPYFKDSTSPVCGDSRRSSSSSGICTISSSCCHNINQQQQQHEHHQEQHQDFKQVKDQHKKHKDTKYYKNYEKMPALETTTTTNTTTTTTFVKCSSNNERQQHPVVLEEEEEAVEVVEVLAKQDNPLLSLKTTATSSSLLLSSSPTAAVVVSSSNSYLRERGRRNNMQQQQHLLLLQQQQKETLKQQTHGGLTVLHETLTPILLSKLPPLMTLEYDKEDEAEGKEEVENEQQRKSPCGRGPLGTNDIYVTTPPTTTLTSSSKECLYPNIMSMLSRCHCSNEQLCNNTMLLTNSHGKNGQNCDVSNSPKEELAKNHHLKLILRNSRREQVEQQQHSEKIKNSYLFYKDKQENELFYSNKKTNLNTTSAATTPNSLNFTTLSTTLSSSSSQISSPSSSCTSSSSSSLSSLRTTPSYTTILNKECRCFITKRDIIGSECNLVQKLSNSTGLASSSSSSASLSDSYCMINTDNGGLASTPSSSSLSASPISYNSSNSIMTTCQWLLALFGCSKLTKTVAVSKWLFMWLLFIILTSSAHCWAGRNDVPTNCTFPVRWEGSWFLSGYQQSIHIKGSQFSYRGRCAASDGNKYLIVDEKGCHRCLVIYEKHKNVLQYKESECEGDSMYMHQTNPSAMAMRSVLNQKTNNNGGDHRGGAHPNLNGHSRLSSSDQYIMRSNDDMNDCPPDFCKGRETLQNLCDQIPGDALLYSLFRESAEPVKCPLKGPFIFTYNRGNGECKSPVSNIESCTEDSRLLLSFQACPDVVGTESTVEELTCLATWKDGNSRYLVGLVSHHHAISNEERYRCFVYEKISSLMDLGHFAGPSMSTSKDAEYKLAQSGDATCNGLDSAEVGSRIMSLRKPPVTERCDFPVWFKGPRHWHVLMGNAVYNYHTNDGSIHIIKPNGYMETRALCEQINKQTSTEMMSVVHYTTGCQSGFMCMMFYRRDTHVIEIQTGKPASRLEDACAPDHFDINKTPYITLLASNPDPQICPMEGLYSLKGAIGPPYLTTRHKRNHNNKVHGLHNHHHQFDSLENNGRGYLHKRHSSLSFRNSQHDEKNAWHSNTRGLPIRSRRDASSTATPVASSPNQTQLAPSTQEILVVGNSTNVGFVQDPDSDTRLRSRRNVPECVTNYKAQRQLWVGCTEPNVIDVRPLCNDEGDEEYSCHGSWSENGTVYIIARHKGTKHGVCISYRPTEGTSAKLVVGDACYRGTQKPPEHHLVANLSVFGKCGETGSTSSSIPMISWFNLIIATILITFLSQLPIQR